MDVCASLYLQQYSPVSYVAHYTALSLFPALKLSPLTLINYGHKQPNLTLQGNYLDTHVVCLHQFARGYSLWLGMAHRAYHEPETCPQ